MANEILKSFKLQPPFKDRTVEQFNLEKAPSDEVFLTVYCNLKKDPQRNQYVDGNSYEYISPWYDSMKEKDLHGIIFYDNLTPAFIAKYQTDKIRFLKIRLGEYSINDERFFIYYNFLSNNLHLKYKTVLMTDVSDVQFNKDPMPFMNQDPSKIYVGMNFHADKGVDAASRSPKWFDRREWKIKPFNQALTDKGYDQEGFKREDLYQIWSAGILGGNISVMLPFLSELCYLFKLVNSKKNINMLLLNYILRKYFTTDYNTETACTKYIFSGKPFNSRYQRFEKYGESECYIIHK